MTFRIVFAALMAALLFAGPIFAGDDTGEMLRDARIRIAKLRATASELTRLAGEVLPDHLSAERLAAARAYIDWLENSARDLNDLAQSWQTGLDRYDKSGTVERSGLSTAAGSATPGAIAATSGSSATTGAVTPASTANGETPVSSTMMVATKEMQQMNQSFNLQYLALQQEIQGENRKFTALSDIMKTKHDTAKNAISNLK